MSLRNKLITVPTIIILAVVTGIWLQATSDDNYVLSVTWRPSALPMRQSVSITVTVDGYPLISRKPRVSPWGETMTAAPGVVVGLTAVSHFQAIEFIDCMIMRNGRSVPGDAHKSIPGPGGITCTA